VTVTRGGEIMRLVRTAAQLHPGQAGQRLRLRLQRLALNRPLPAASRWLLTGPDRMAGPGWPSQFTPLDARPLDAGRLDASPFGVEAAARTRAGELCLLGETRMIAPPAADGTARWEKSDWAAADAPLLWRYHLYYWDWAWALASELPAEDARAVFGAAWGSWHAAVGWGRGPAWYPYPAALRAWSFCGLFAGLVRGSGIEAAYRGELAALTGFLRRNLETDVGGNHLVKNLKALAGLAVFFGDDALLSRTLGRIGRELKVQLLPDGGHYERAPAYHCQVLGDLIDLTGLLSAAGHPIPAELDAAVTAMRSWLGAVLDPAGQVPLLNDGFPVDPGPLRPSAPPEGPLHLLPDTGLARIAVGGWHLLVDVGLPCPAELPAHAHADTLGCVVHLDRQPLLVDAGTSGYAAGAARDYERSTAAHNTLDVDGRDSTEVWGAFRAGRRARVRDVQAGVDHRSGVGPGVAPVVTVQAVHDGYRGLPGRPAHGRRWTVRADELRVDDTVTGGGRHRVTVRWHLAPGLRLRLERGGAVVTGPAGEVAVVVAVTANGEPALASLTGPVSAGFGRTVQAPVLACTVHHELPITISTRWRRAGSRQEAV
jgi:uncharacterized heparinase superfamily protein